MTLLDYLKASPHGTLYDYLAQPPVGKPSGPATYVTYLSIGDDTARFGPAAINVAGDLRTGLAVWIDGVDLTTLAPSLPNKGALQSIHDRLAGGKGVDLSSPAVPAMLALFAAGVPQAGVMPLVTPEQARSLLSIGYTLAEPMTQEQFDAAKTLLARQADASAIRSRVTAYLNDVLAPAEADAALPLVTPEQHFGGGE